MSQEVDRVRARFKELAGRAQQAREASLEALARSSDLLERSVRNLGNQHLGPAPAEPLAADEQTETKVD